MNSKRLFRLAAIAGAVAAGVAVIRSLSRDSDPLPTPADGPTEPWPPLRTSPVPAPSPEPATADDVDEQEAGPEPVLNLLAPEPEAEPEIQPEAVSAPTKAATKATPKRRRSEPLRATWMPPGDDGSCPDGYPLKANDQSMIFHAPGQMSYDRTVPERCYASPDAATADGYRAAKR